MNSYRKYIVFKIYGMNVSLCYLLVYELGY